MHRLSLNEDKTRFTFCHRPQDRDNLPLHLPALKIDNYEIKRPSSIKFLGILVDEHLSWIDHINNSENKLSKNFLFLNAKAMKNLYFSFFHSYLTYGNIAWYSTSMTIFKKIFSKQKQAIKTISITSLDYKDLKSDRLGFLNIFELNIYHKMNLMFRVKSNTIPEALRTKFQIVQHNCPATHSENNFEEPKITFEATKFEISSRVPRLLNKHNDRFLKTRTSALLFKAKLNEYLVKLRNVTNYF